MGLVPNFLQSIGLALANATVIESIFSIPGFGYLIVNHVLDRDTPMIHAEVFFLALAIALCNIAADLVQWAIGRKKGGGVNENEAFSEMVCDFHSNPCDYFLFAGFLFAPNDPMKSNLLERYADPSAEYPFGTDALGHWRGHRALVALTVSYILRYIKLVRTRTDMEMGKAYVMCAIASGASKLRIMLIHIFPNLIAEMIRFLCLSCADMILAITGFSFIGLGLGDNVVDWGSMILDARGALVLHPTMILYPIGAVILSTLCFNVIGRQLTTKEAE